MAMKAFHHRKNVFIVFPADFGKSYQLDLLLEALSYC